jgi:serine protease Do
MAALGPAWREFEEHMKRHFIACAALGIFLALDATSIYAQATREKKAERTEKQTEAKNNPPLKFRVDNSTISRSAPNSYAPVIKKAAPSVVSLLSKRTVQDPEFRGNPLLNDPFLRRFFGPQVPDQDQFDEEEPQPRQRGNRSRPRSHQETGLGSGVIVTEDGYIITNNHVIEGADDVEVETASGARYIAKVIGADAPSDVAILKIDAKNLPAITVGSSENLEVGDVVLAIGNPFGIGQTVTMGIISGVSRALGITQYDDLIQTDAAINMGNSGGALIDAQGRLIGLNTAILSRTGGNVGVGFAVPINMVRHISESLTQYGKVSRGLLGIKMDPMTPKLAAGFSLPEGATGVIVSDWPRRRDGSTVPSPARDAGVKIGDVITAFNGVEVRDDSHLRLMVSQTKPGTECTIKLLRDGKSQAIKLKLGELSDDLVAGVSGETQEEKVNDSEALEGVTVGDIDPESRRQFRIPNDVQGVLVTDVDPDSKAYQEGLRPGHVILEMGSNANDRKPVKSAEDAVKMSEKAKGDSTLLRIWTQGNRRFMTVENGRNEPKKSNNNNNERPQRQRQNREP